MNFTVNLEIEANDKAALQEKLQAFQDLQDHLSHADLVSSVEVIVENPEIVEFIKEVVPEDGRELSLSDYVGIAKKAFSRFATA